MNNNIIKSQKNSYYQPIFKKKIKKINIKNNSINIDNINQNIKKIFINMIFKIFKNNMEINQNSETKKTNILLFTDIFHDIIIKKCKNIDFGLSTFYSRTNLKI